MILKRLIRNYFEKTIDEIQDSRGYPGRGSQYGTVYYCDNNLGSDSYDGLSRKFPLKTLSTALAASHAKQATTNQWALRNAIYVSGDDHAENLTKLAQKTDVIGVGSDDGNKGPRITGHHVIEARATGKDYMGCRLFNITFKPSTTTVLFDIPTAQNGIEFHGCKWEWAASCTTGLRLTTCQDTVVDNCRFVKGSGTGFSTAAIQIATGAINQTIIRNNYIDANLGVIVNSGTTGEGNLIDNNIIVAVGLTVDDDSDKFYVTRNILISEAAYGSSAFDFNLAKAAGNIITGNNDTKMVPIHST